MILRLRGLKLFADKCCETTLLFGEPNCKSFLDLLLNPESLVANLYIVDAVIQDRGIENMAELLRVSAQDFGDWLDVDAVMYGRLVH
jgi:hypothetical protein